MTMKRSNVAIRLWLPILALGALIWATPVVAQSKNLATGDRDDMTRQQLAGFDQFLDNHPELNEQIRQNPSLVNNEEFVEKHPDLQNYLTQHPQVREDLQRNRNAVMGQERRFDRREDWDSDRDRDRNHDRRDDITRGEMANMDRFMDSHPEIAEQLRKNPSLVNNKDFVEDHTALRQFLSEHPELREEFKENPGAFMQDEQHFDRHEDRRDRDVTRGELSNMDRFMDAHPEIAEQLRKNPSLVNNKDFVGDHPALQQFLASHPGVREEYKENPNAFMSQERRYDHRENSPLRHDGDVTRDELSSFHEFLEGHNTIATELSKNPSLANNEEYLQNHSALRDYLNSNPKVREELHESPQSFLASTQQFDPKGISKLPTSPKTK